MSKSLTIKELRKQVLRWTQDEMALAMGVTRRTIANYEKGKAPLMALKLAQSVMSKELNRRRAPIRTEGERA